MLKITSFAFSLAVVALLTGCPKKPTVDADAGAIVLNIDAGAAVADAAVADTTTDAATPLAVTGTTTAATAHGCPAGQATFNVDGKHTCETVCNAKKGNNNECTEPTACLGVAPLVESDGGSVTGEYCRTAPSGACTGANQAQFWNNNAGGRPTCETLCKAPNDTSCPTGTTCKGNAMLFLVNGNKGQLHRFCQK